MKKKHWIGSLSVIIVLAVIVLLTLRWDAWFGEKEEEAFTLSSKIQRCLISPGENGMLDRSINWVTGVDSTENKTVDQVCLVSLQASNDSICYPAQSDTVRTMGGVSVMHHVKLRSLRPGTYRYHVHSNGDSYSNEFKIEADSTQAETFIYIGDIQERTESFAKALFDDIHERHPEAIAWAFAGDMVERPEQKYWAIWYHSVKDILPSTPILSVTGNHEYHKGLIKKVDKRWKSSFNYPLNGPKGKEGMSYYVDYPLIRFICLDSDGINLGPSLFNTRSWLKETLQSRGKRRAIVMFHHGIHSVREGRLNAIMKYGFQKILENKHYGADFVLQGHDHAYSRIISKRYNNSLQRPVYLISVCSEKFYRNGFERIHDKIGSGFALYQVIQVRGDSISYAAYDSRHQLYDSLLMVQNKVMDYGKEIPERYEFSFPDTPKGKKKEQAYQKQIEERARMLRNNR